MRSFRFETGSTHREKVAQVTDLVKDLMAENNAKEQCDKLKSKYQTPNLTKTFSLDEIRFRRSGPDRNLQSVYTIDTCEFESIQTNRNYGIPPFATESIS